MADQNKVQWVYAAKSLDELSTKYDEWAVDYDADLERAFGWRGHVAAVDIFLKYVTTDSRVMDVGVGTGLAGFELLKRGFSLLDGFDLSEGMLEQARKRGIYRDLRVGILGEPLNYPTGAYDAAIATGVFTVGHAPASGWDEVARIVAPGGFFVLTIRPDIWEPGGYETKEKELTDAGKWKLAEVAEGEVLLPKGEPDVIHQIRVYQILV
jgi:SAM-dependent methyltransferase